MRWTIYRCVKLGFALLWEIMSSTGTDGFGPGVGHDDEASSTAESGRRLARNTHCHEKHSLLRVDVHVAAPLNHVFSPNPVTRTAANFNSRQVERLLRSMPTWGSLT
jgi:hypothetical protein